MSQHTLIVDRMQVDETYHWLVINATLRAQDYTEGLVEYQAVENWAERIQQQIVKLHTGDLLSLLHLPQS